MINEDLKKVLSIVSEAQDKIFLAQSYYDKRKKEKAIRDAKTYAQNLVLPYSALLEKELDLSLNGELFSWGFLEDDLQRVNNLLSEKIKHIY